ncbi:MAG: hypothetical protein ACE363_12265 [Alphaproteobacteria bacterium]
MIIDPPAPQQPTKLLRQATLLQAGTAAEANGDSPGVLRALDGLCRLANVPDDVHESMRDAIASGGTLIKTVWAETGGCPESLFAFLPGCQHCLTQAKSAYGMGAESDWFVEELDLLGNDLIPTSPDGIRPEALPEFARLQENARTLAD